MEARVVKSVVTFLFCFNLVSHSSIFSAVGLSPTNYSHFDQNEVPEEPHEILEEETPVAVCSSKSLTLGGTFSLKLRGLWWAAFTTTCLITSKFKTEVVKVLFMTTTKNFYFIPIINRLWRNFNELLRNY